MDNNLRSRLRSVLDFAAEIILFVSVILLYFNFSVVWPRYGGLYSTFLCHYLQVSALLKGKLLLSPGPLSFLPDFLWTNHGMAQNFGLGIPLLELPFEAVARWCGSSPFPDRLILFFYIIATILILSWALGSALKIFGLGSGLLEFLARWYMIIWILLGAPMLGLLQWHFFYFEKTVFYGCLCSCLLLSLLWLFMRKPSSRAFLFLCAASGLSYLVRPTLIAYGTATVLTAAIYVRQNGADFKLVLKGLLLFLGGCSIGLAFNYLRFDNPLEFGYSVNFSSVPAVDYALRFGYPFRHVPVFSAVKEFAGALFFDHAYWSATYRFREGAFPVFNAYYLAVLALGFLLFLFLSLRRSKQNDGRAQWLRLTLGWGLGCCGLLFIFYTYYPSLASRYLSDFTMALNAIFVSLVVAVLSLLLSKPWRKLSVVIFLVLLGGLFYICNKGSLTFFKAYKDGTVCAYNTDRAGLRRMENEFYKQAAASTRLPGQMSCHGVPVKGMRYSGWDIVNSCKVAASTSILLPAARCFILDYSTDRRGILQIRVKRNFKLLKWTGVRRFKGHVRESFCSGSLPAYPFALYTIGWVPAADLREGAYPVVLNSVRVSD